MKLLKLIIIFFISMSIYGQQSKYSVGGGIGFGLFTGNFPSQTTFSNKLFFDFHSPFVNIKAFRFHLIFSQKLEKFIPSSNNFKHYSYMTSFGFSTILNQPINNNIYIEEELGLIYLNDRSFNDINTWNYGLIFGLNCGTDITDNFDLSLNLNYGLTFSNTNPGFVIYLIKGKFIL